MISNFRTSSGVDGVVAMPHRLDAVAAVPQCARVSCANGDSFATVSYNAGASCASATGNGRKGHQGRPQWLKDPTPLWARCTNWRLMLKGPLKEPLALPTKDAANEPIIYPKPIEEFEGIRSLIENVVAFLNPRSIGRAVRLGRRWAEVGYDEPLYYCLVQVGQPSVTIYAFQARVDAVVHTGEAILASVDKGVSAFHVDTGEFLGKTSIRDTSAIPTLFITGHSLWTVVGMVQSENGPYHMTCATLNSELVGSTTPRSTT